MSPDRIILHLLILIMWLISLQYHAWLHMCRTTHYVPFDTNLNLLKKNKNCSIPPSFLWYSSVSCLSLVLLTGHEANFLHFSLAFMPPNFDFLSYLELMFYLFSKFKKHISMTFLVTSAILMFSIATTANAQYLCICVLQIFCFSFSK